MTRTHALRSLARRATFPALLAACVLAAPSVALADGGTTVVQQGSANGPTIAITGSTGPNSWTAFPYATVTASATEYSSSDPVWETVCKVDGNNQTIQLGTQQSVSVSGDGVHLIDCYAVAQSGAVSDTVQAVEQIDSQAPAVTFTGAPAAPAWNTGTVNVIASATETNELSGIASVACSTGGASTSTAGENATVALSGSAQYTVTCRATTNSGAVGPFATEHVWVDNTAPTITFTDQPSSSLWYNQAQPVTIVATTPPSLAALASVSCFENGVGYFPAVAGGTLTVPAPTAVHTWTLDQSIGGTEPEALSCYATDIAGNQSAPVSVSAQFDTQAPRATFLTATYKKVTALATDDLSGVEGATLSYERHGKWITLPSTQSGDKIVALVPSLAHMKRGKYPLRLTVTDNAGNETTGTTYADGKTAVLNYDPPAQPLKLKLHAPPASKGGSVRKLGLHLNSPAVVTYGQPVTISGTATAGSGLAAGLRFAVTIKAGGHVEHETARANGSGKFSVTVPTTAPSATVSVSYPGSKDVKAASAAATIRVAGRVTLAVESLKYGLWTLSGVTVSGPWAIPANGLRVGLFWRAPDGAWHYISSAETTPAGLLHHWGIPVPPVKLGTRVQIQARVLTHGSYAGAASPTLTATVQG